MSTPITIAAGTTGTIDTSGSFDVTLNIASTLDITGSMVTADFDLISALALNAAVIVENGATADLTGIAGLGALNTFDIQANSHLEIAPVINVAIGQEISFTGADAALTLDSGLTLSLLSDIENFHNHDSIVLPGHTITSVTFVPGTAGSSEGITVDYSDNTSAFIALSGSYQQNQFSIENQDTIINSAPCYAAGTRILTVRGEVPVEELRVGDLLVTHFGRGTVFKPIRWIGWRDVDIAGHPRSDLVRPVRIRANAFADGLPRRDLIVSPDHALFIDGVLISAGKLVNGVSIAQELGSSTMRYFHVELNCHDIVLAEGMPAESYLDTGNRSQFVNGAAVVALHPNFAPPKRMQTDACVPFLENGPAVAAVRRQPIERLAAQGFVVSHDPDLHLLVNGRVVRPASVQETVYRFELREQVQELRIVSRSFTPAGVSAADEDCRRLGVCLAGITLNTGGLTQDIPIADPMLGEGLYETETNGMQEWRWTNGDARLSTSLLDQADQVTLELRLLWPGSYWTAPEQQQEVKRLSA